MDLINLGDLVAREREYTHRFCEAALITYPSDLFVAQALKSLPELSPNWRFVPGGIDQKGPLRSCQLSGIKLYGGTPEAASEKGRENSVTLPSLIYGDLGRLFLPTGLVGRPFNLTKSQHIAWAAEQRGQGLAFAPEVLFLWARCALEEQRPLWSYGAVRCADICGSAYALRVCFGAAGGLGVGWCHGDDSSGRLGAVARKVIVLGS